MPSIAIPLVALLVAAAPQQPATPNAQRLRWVPNPTQTTHGWVSDPAQHLSAETVRRIDSTIFALERTTSDEMAVVVIDSLDGLEPSEAALLLHRRWGVGKRDKNNGILFLWSPALRKIYVSVGYRLEGVLPDARVGRIEDDVILPAFRDGDFDRGVLAGVTALAAAAAGDTTVSRSTVPAYHPPAAEPAVRAPVNPPAPQRSPLLWGALLSIAGLFGIGAVAWARRRPRSCPNGHGRMMRLDESADDARLSREQRLEEDLHSVNYDVWVCRQCPETIVVPHAAWFSSYHRCAHCGRRTSRSRSKMLIVATTANEGLVEVTTYCENCRVTDVKRRVTPQLVAAAAAASAGASSSSFGGGSFGGSGGGGGGGSSFGGGSAGGGGAGRSY